MKYLFLLVCALNSFLFAESYQAKVVGVSDGDTIKVLKDNKQIKIRFGGIDCPESNQAFGTKAKKFTSDQCFGKTVTVNPTTIDRYGRTIADIVLSDKKILNQELVKNGLAWHYKHYSKDPVLAKLENEAKSNKIGLWSEKNPTPPWDFRKNKRIPKKTETKTENKVEQTVYVTRTGKKYHRDGCRYLKSKKPISLNKAKLSYQPCKVCRP